MHIFRLVSVQRSRVQIFDETTVKLDHIQSLQGNSEKINKVFLSGA